MGTQLSNRFLAASSSGGSASPLLMIIYILTILAIIVIIIKKIIAKSNGYISIGKHIALLLFTFKIWKFVWIFRTTKYFGSKYENKYSRPVSELLLCMFLPFYFVYWIYKTTKLVDLIASEKNGETKLSIVCLTFAIFIPIISMIILQDKINEIVLLSEGNV